MYLVLDQVDEDRIKVLIAEGCKQLSRTRPPPHYHIFFNADVPVPDTSTLYLTLLFEMKRACVPYMSWSNPALAPAIVERFKDQIKDNNLQEKVKMYSLQAGVDGHTRLENVVTTLSAIVRKQPQDPISLVLDLVNCELLSTHEQQPHKHLHLATFKLDPLEGVQMSWYSPLWTPELLKTIHNRLAKDNEAALMVEFKEWRKNRAKPAV